MGHESTTVTVRLTCTHAQSEAKWWATKMKVGIQAGELRGSKAWRFRRDPSLEGFILGAAPKRNQGHCISMPIMPVCLNACQWLDALHTGTNMAPPWVSEETNGKRGRSVTAPSGLGTAGDHVRVWN
jgi:hypothetical protein